MDGEGEGYCSASLKVNGLFSFISLSSFSPGPEVSFGHHSQKRFIAFLFVHP